MIDFDTSRLPLGTREWAGLLSAIENAAPEDESDWIEWKSTLDLADKNHVAHIAKAIVAFANRDPLLAREKMEGRGVLVVGVSPGQVSGVSPRDPAELDRAVRALLDADAPRFTFHWIAYRDTTVLIVEVAQPWPGDPIHSIAKSSGPVTDGNIFVRRPGRSDKATSADIRALSARLLSGSESVGLDIELLADVGDGLPCWRPDGHWVEDWLEAERAYLMTPLEESLLPKTKWELVGMHGGMDFLSEPEKRTPEEYTDLVDEYIEECRASLPAVEVLVARYVLSPVVFKVLNRTDQNYESLRVQVHIEGDVEAHEDIAYEPNLHDYTPQRPRRWGPRPSAALRLSRQSQFLASALPPYVSPPPALRPDINNGGSTTVTFLPVHLRPHAIEIVEDELVFITTTRDTEALSGTWTATATNVPGLAEGTIEIPLAGTALDGREVLAHEVATSRPLRPEHRDR